VHDVTDTTGSVMKLGAGTPQGRFDFFYCILINIYIFLFNMNTLYNCIQDTFLLQ
jgi:hypothetical protein